jgi:hypothetical protein
MVVVEVNDVFPNNAYFLDSWATNDTVVRPNLRILLPYIRHDFPYIHDILTFSQHTNPSFINKNKRATNQKAQTKRRLKSYAKTKPTPNVKHTHTHYYNTP